MATQKQVFTEITESIDRCNHTLPGLIQFLKNGFKKLENASGGGGGGSTVAWTQTQAQATGTKIAEIEIDGDTTNVYAPAVSATQIQSTGTKIASLTIGGESTDLYAPTTSVSVQAEDVAYNNTVSGLTADDVQGAIDELAQGSGGDVVLQTITADGVKTYGQIITEMYSDFSNLTINSKIKFTKNNGDTVIFRLVSLSTTSATFSSASVSSSQASILEYVVSAEGKYYNWNGSTVGDSSSSVATSGFTFTLYK